MTQIERIEKTTEIFKKAKTDIYTVTILNEVQKIIEDYLNEHVGAAAPLEMPFLIRSLESRLQFYKNELQKHPQLMFLYSVLNASESKKEITTVTMPNIFAERNGNKND